MRFDLKRHFERGAGASFRKRAALGVVIFLFALGAVVLFLIAAGLLPLAAAVVAGSLAAVSPQLAWNCVLLLPDTVSVLPLLLAFYCLLQASKRGGAVALALLAGVLVGVSCW